MQLLSNAFSSGSFSPFLNANPQAPASWWCLYRPASTLYEIPTIASVLGAQLVSLRLGVLVNPVGRVWDIEEYLTNFPRLQFFHVDILQASFPAYTADEACVVLADSDVFVLYLDSATLSAVSG